MNELIYRRVMREILQIYIGLQSRDFGFIFGDFLRVRRIGLLAKGIRRSLILEELIGMARGLKIS